MGVREWSHSSFMNVLWHVSRYFLLTRFLNLGLAGLACLTAMMLPACVAAKCMVVSGEQRAVHAHSAALQHGDPHWPQPAGQADADASVPLQGRLQPHDLMTIPGRPPADTVPKLRLAGSCELRGAGMT